ncbi:hypothetical protein R3P38DRAFT_2407535, partial [Favolaschia claudopus]
WLKRYLNFGPERPLWCFVADELLAHRAVSADLNVDEALRYNTYLQSWAPYQSALNLKSKDLATMMAVGRKYGVRAEAIAIDREILDTMPIWHHKFSDGDRRLFNSPENVVSCLKDKHRLRWVKDARELANKAGSNRHTHRVDCRCAACRVTRAITGCGHPHKCYLKAQALLNSIEDKWDPRVMQPEDYIRKNLLRDQEPTAHEDENTADFDTRVTTKGTLADVFRIFTNDESNGAHTAPTTKFANEQQPMITVFTDGSAIDNDTEDVKAGAGVFFGDGDTRNKALRVPEMLGPSNQVGEVLAIKEAIEAAPLDAPL